MRELTPERSPAHRLGAELRAYRRKRGMTHEDLAGLVHVSVSLIGKIEQGLRIASEDVIRECDERLDAGGDLCALWSAASTMRRARGRPALQTPTKKTGADDGSARALTPLERAVMRVESSFGVSLDRSALIEHRGTLGARSDRGTWIRLASRGGAEFGARGWGGIEAAAGLCAEAVPEWLGAISWRDRDSGTFWRADELAIVEDRPVAEGMYLCSNPELPDSWWGAWSTTLNAFTDHGHARSDHGEILSDVQVAAVIARVWPDAAGVRITERSAAHGAMTWAKVTAPRCWILGWSHWTDAPRGFDAASLWSCSLSVPQVAARIWRERSADLDSPSGATMALYCLARILTDPAVAHAPLAGLARDAAVRLLPVAAQSAA